MTLAELQELITQSPADVVSGLQKTSFPNLPKWSDLEEQYNPKKHKIYDTTIYPAKLDDNNNDDFKRTSFALQKLVTARVAQSMFSNSVKRKYSYEKSDKAETAEAILEEVYRTKNKIDSSNIQRAKMLNATCQVVTIWRAYEKDDVVKGETTKYKLTHDSYSEKDGYTLYPIMDQNGEPLVISIGYKGTDNVEYLDSYLNLVDGKAEYRKYFNGESGWELYAAEGVINPQPLEVFPALYTNIEEPIWGGDSGTEKVEQLEEMESYDGLYIKRNSLPTFTMDYGELPPGSTQNENVESSSDSRRIIPVGKGGKMDDVTWKGAEQAIQNRFDRMRNAFFEEIQVPDTSFANMIKSNTSAENKDLIFADARAKAKDVGGVWESLFYDELEIVKKFLSIMFPSYASEYEAMSIRSEIQPYSIKTKKDTAEYVSIAGGSMSLSTKVGILNEVDDVEQEVDEIQQEQSASINQGL